ncbi:MAG TPA: aldehyde dehydrogenase family protein [Chitinophagales bacterium]|nr:aldehyde dehydrogenase family protein [Chitinophagales bacterium]
MPKTFIKKSYRPKININSEILSQLQVNGKENGQRLRVQKTYKIYVDGKFPRTESGRYYKLKNQKGRNIANISRSSRKDFRDAVAAARNAFEKWSAHTAFNRGQIIYRIAEMLEGRCAQFVSELIQQGSSVDAATSEVTLAIDRLVYYAGWADKYQQIFSSVNPVNASYFNFSLCEPTGVVSIVTPEENSLAGLVASFVPAIVGGNTCVILASERQPLCAITLAEVLHASDVPGGVVNILTGFRRELLGHFSSHMDVNAIIYCGDDEKEIKTVQENAALNVKRVIIRKGIDWMDESAENPYFILDTQEIKTTWHPVGT